MNFLTRKTSWRNIELWIYKFAIFSGSVLIGAYFADTVISFTKYFLILFIVSTVWATWMWFNKMKKEE